MRDFTEGNIVRQLLYFSVPMLIGTVFQQLYYLINAAVVGNFVGSGALAAVGTATPILNVLTPLLIGVTNGASMLISQFYGAKQDEQLQRTVSTAVLSLGAAIIFITVLGLIATPSFLALLQTPADIFDDAVLYLRISLCGLAFMMFYNLYTSFLRALGDSKTPLFILIFSSLLNIALDLAFVIVVHWGVGGVAWATLISQALATLLCYLYSQRKVPEFRITKLVFDFQLFRHILTYGIPNAVQLSLTSLAHLTIQHLVNGFGSVAIAGIAAATRIDNFAYLPLTSISVAISTMVAQNMGASNELRAKEVFKKAMAIMLPLSIAISALIWIFGGNLIAMFVSDTEPARDHILEIGIRNLSIIVSFYTLFAFFFGYNGFFRGAGDNVVVMALTILSLTLRAVAANILVAWFGFGPEAVAWSIPIGWGTCCLLCAIYYQRRMWAGKVVIRPKSA